MKQYIFTLLFACFGLIAIAQKGMVSGTLTDATTTKPVHFATVSVYRVADSALVSYRLSDEKGNFQVTLLPLGTPLRMIVTTMGYDVFRKEFQLPAGDEHLALKTVPLTPSTVGVGEVEIRAERPPVIVKKDTIEFNAASFKTLPDALVEDLLRKLPGVNVDKDGNILVNGRRVNTIYVDGKDFFGGDVRIASKNLPANTIDKIQVTNDPEALRFNPLMNEADIPQVINLKLKPGIKKGAFGKIYGGGGVADKFEGGALLNFFRDTTQLSILGYGNNLNKSSFAFEDIRSVGGFNRGGWGNANGNGMGGLSIDKVSFGGFGNGIMNSSGGGFNLNTIVKKTTHLNLSYFYGAVRSDYDELRNSQQAYGDTLMNTRQNMRQLGDNAAHMVSSKIQFKLFPKVAIEFKPTLVFSRDHVQQSITAQATSNQQGLLNNRDTDHENTSSTFTYLSWFRIIPTFTKKGRVLSFTNSFTIDNADADNFTYGTNTFYQTPGATIQNQLRDADARNLRNTVFARYTDLLNANLTFSAGLTAAYFRTGNNIGTFIPDATGQYLIELPIFSQQFLRRGFQNDLTAGFRYKKDKFSIGSGLGFTALNAENEFATGATPQNFAMLLPSAEIGYGIFNLSWTTAFREPALANLQPGINNTNAVLIFKGNPNLKPARLNMLNLSLRKFDTKRLMTYNFGINGSTTNNATVLSRTIDPTGVQQTTPVNANGIWSVGNSLSLQKDWKLPNNRQFSVIVSNSASINESMVLLNQLRSDVQTLSIRPGTEIRINLDDKFEYNQSYTFTYNNSSYADPGFISQRVNYHDSRSELIFRAGKLVWETTLDYRYNSNNLPGLLKSFYKWNAGVTYLFLAGNRGQLKLAVNDILDQNIIATRVVRDNFTEDLQGSTIRRFGLLTFTYNLRSFGGKVGGRNQLFRF